MNESDKRPETADDESRAPAADEVARQEPPVPAPSATPSRRFYANLNDV
ncbi:MAG TPA: hypothetical protein VG435_18915 [Acidimicrobiales bacterium]|nr:hypothetical protein [Acidimicrobiales bacterium]